MANYPNVDDIDDLTQWLDDAADYWQERAAWWDQRIAFLDRMREEAQRDLDAITQYDTKHIDKESMQ